MKDATPGGGEVVTLRVPLSDLKSARTEPLLSGGRLVVTTQSGALIPVVTYSMRSAAQFSEAARGVEQLIAGEPLAISLDADKDTCENCGRVLPEKDGICPACINRNRTLLRVAGYLAPYKKQAIALALTSIATTAINLAPPTIQGALVDRVFTKHQDVSLLWQLVALWLGALVVSGLLQWVAARLTAWLAGHIATDLRASVYRAVEFLQLQFFDRKQVGQITSRITQDTDSVWHFLSEGLPFLVSNLLLVVGVVALLFMVSWKLALAIIAPVPIVGFMSAFFWKEMSHLFGRFSNRWGASTPI